MPVEGRQKRLQLGPGIPVLLFPERQPDDHREERRPDGPGRGRRRAAPGGGGVRGEGGGEVGDREGNQPAHAAETSRTALGRVARPGRRPVPPATTSVTGFTP